MMVIRMGMQFRGWKKGAWENAPEYLHTGSIWKQSQCGMLVSMIIPKGNAPVNAFNVNDEDQNKYLKLRMRKRTLRHTSRISLHRREIYEASVCNIASRSPHSTYYHTKTPWMSMRMIEIGMQVWGVQNGAQNIRARYFHTGVRSMQMEYGILCLVPIQ